MRIDVNSDEIERLIKGLNEFEKTLAPKAMNAALNKVGNKVTGVTRAIVAKTIGVTQRGLKDMRVGGRKKTGLFVQIKATRHTGQYILITKYGEIPIKEFGAVQDKYGVHYKIGRKSYKIKSAFIVKKYGDNVYKRAGKDRFPIEKRWGPVPANIVRSAQSEDKIRRVIAERVPAEFKRAMRAAIMRAVKSI